MDGFVNFKNEQFPSDASVDDIKKLICWLMNWDVRV